MLEVEGQRCNALLDTGSMVSTISETFYQDHLSHIELRPLEDILQVEGAAGHRMPYNGYIKVDIKIPETGDVQTALLLVVPSTAFHRSTPILLGTNVIRYCLEKLKEGSGSTSTRKDIPSAWEIVHRCITAYEKQRKRTNGEAGIVKSAASSIVVLQSNETKTLLGKVKRPYCFHQTVMCSHTDKSILPKGVEIAPSVINLKPNIKDCVSVTLSNLTTQTVVIPPNASLCCLQEVERLEVKDSQEQPDTDDIDVQLDLTETEKHLNSEELTMLKITLEKWKFLFSKDDLDLGHTDAIKHRIHLTDDRPFKQRFRRIPPAMFNELKQHLKQMLDSGVIRKSHSPWASNIVPVRKDDGKIRFCIDYRQLNERTVKDAYAIPRIEDTLDILHGKSWFSCVDLKSGYWQVEMDERDKAYTAFTVGPLGLYECNRLPFGLSNAPATFQRLIEQVLGDLNMSIAVVYLDDIIIFSNSHEEHLQHIEAVFEKIRRFGLKLNASKCQFFRQKIKYLGHVVSSEGLEVDSSKTETLKTWPIPTSVEELRTFLGFTGYFRRFVKNYARIAKPLNDLLTGNGNKTNRKKQKAKKASWKWDKEQQEAFDELIDKLTSPPILAFPDYEEKFILHTDASLKGLGAVLCQRRGGKEKPIAYASRGLKNAEKKYPAHKLEFLALKWAVTDRFNDMLYGHSFEVVTDNNPLTYVLTTAKLDATGHRWLAALTTFDFTIKYLPGKSNKAADSLSRLPQDAHCSTITPEMIKAIKQNNQEDIHLVEATAMNISITDHVPEETESIDSLSYQRWRKAQREDPTIQSVIQGMSQGFKASSNLKEARNLLLKERKRLFLKRGVLYRKRIENDSEIHQLVLPNKFCCQVLSGLHDDVGHPGIERTLSLVQQRFYWPSMTKDVTTHVTNCSRCILRKAVGDRAPLVNITTSQPLELVCIDYLTIEPSKGGVENVLVLTDHFTKYAQAYPTTNQTAKTTAKILFENFILHYGFPLRLHSDQGRNFESHVIRELCKFAGISKSHTTPYHAMGNGICERFNRSLLQMLGTLSGEQKEDWKSSIGPLVHAYNCIKHANTGYSPFFLMFGRQPRLPVDVIMGLPEDKNDIPYSDFIASLRDKLDYAYKLATKTSETSRIKQKTQYDKHVKHTKLNPGDRVLVRQTAFKGKHKLANRWENEPYIVVRQPNEDIPVFVLRKENGREERSLHRNLLLPIGTLPIENKADKLPPKKSRSEVTSVLEHTSEAWREESSDEEDENMLSSVEEKGEDRINEEIPVETFDAQSDEDREVERGESESATEEELITEGHGMDVGDGRVLEEETRLLPRRSGRTSRPPQRYGDFAMMQTSSMEQMPKAPTPLPRKSLVTSKSTSLIEQSVQPNIPVPTPRHIKQQSKRELLNSVLQIQGDQCRVQDVILTILQDT